MCVYSFSDSDWIGYGPSYKGIKPITVKKNIYIHLTTDIDITSGSSVIPVIFLTVIVVEAKHDTLWEHIIGHLSHLQLRWQNATHLISIFVTSLSPGVSWPDLLPGFTLKMELKSFI